MSQPKTSRFSKQTLDFLKRASRQKKSDWLDRNREEFENLVRLPLQHLARKLATTLRPLAAGYHFPLKGLGRLKRSAIRVQEYGGGHFKSYVSFTITRPSKSRFDHNPSIYFMIDSDDDEGDEVLLAGGLYMPSSRQLRSIREKIADNPKPFEVLFKSKVFRASFPEGFSDERTATRPPRGFDPGHSHIHWLKLQGFFVWRSYSKKQYLSVEFPEIVLKDAKQILRLNELLEQAISMNWSDKTVGKKAVQRRNSSLLERTGDETIILPTPDF